MAGGARFGIQSLPVPHLLKGTKQYITNAPVADVLLVYAVDPDRPGLAGLSAFLVDAATPGLAVSSSFEKMGLRDLGIERDLRDAVASTIYSGTSEIQRVVLARMLGL